MGLFGIGKKKKKPEPAVPENVEDGDKSPTEYEAPVFAPDPVEGTTIEAVMVKKENGDEGHYTYTDSNGQKYNVAAESSLEQELSAKFPKLKVSK